MDVALMPNSLSLLASYCSRKLVLTFSGTVSWNEAIPVETLTYIKSPCSEILR